MAKKVYIADIKNPSLTRALRLKCMDCAGTSDNIRDCHICKCPLWSFRFGKGTAAAIRTLSKTYDVCLVDTNKTDYIEELKGKKLKRPQ